MILKFYTEGAESASRPENWRFPAASCRESSTVRNALAFTGQALDGAGADDPAWW